MDRRAHWETIYRAKGYDQVSWFQREATTSLALIRSITPDPRSRIIDIGGGASTLVDGLLASGFGSVTVLDVSPTALGAAATRLGSTRARVSWIEADVLEADLPRAAFDLWHDRAVFHFFTEPADRARYAAQARHAVKPGGHVIVAAFAHDGPTRCSGLPVARYTPDALRDALGAGFVLIESVREEHVTPSGETQAFVYCLCRIEDRPATSMDAAGRAIA
jgi:ubiquinone/menaquinone biosynthesis C-methylase UbiE